MTGNWQNKILHFNIPPPTEVWEKIADQLEEEFKAEDIAFSQKMEDFEIVPPAFILGNVLNEVNADPAPRKTARVFILSRRQIAITAVTIGLIALALLYFLNPELSPTQKTSTADVLPAIPGSAPSPSTENKAVNPGAIARSGDEAGPLSNVPDRKLAQSATRNRRNTEGLKYVQANRIFPANAISPISVTAPPIYDENGNIIMDESLVSAPDENYVIVTSPNGEQTKISRKFIKMLCMMNGGIDYNYMNAENYLWKLRFEEWRSKLLEQASYIPTANNFLDIMDLKELLQEN